MIVYHGEQIYSKGNVFRRVNTGRRRCRGGEYVQGSWGAIIDGMSAVGRGKGASRGASGSSSLKNEEAVGESDGDELRGLVIGEKEELEDMELFGLARTSSKVSWSSLWMKWQRGPYLQKPP